MSFVVRDEHRKIFNATGHLLITGGPGSGKTTVALQKAKLYIDSNKLAHSQNVLFLSFSRAAVARILNQIAEVGELASYKKRLTIQTFHSFFWDILKTHGYLIGSPRRLTVLPPHDEESLREGRPVTDPDWLQERERIVYNQGKVCFDLFAPLTYRILTRSQKICSSCTQKFPLIIVDEAQDTDTQQWKCLETFKNRCQVLFLADLDQQIHDYRKDVTAERINDITESLSPRLIPLGEQNFRSGGTEILNCAHDILSNSPRNGSYRGISHMAYNPRADGRDKCIRQSIGIVNRIFEEAHDRTPDNIAMLATWGKGVKIISHALRGNGGKSAIPHRVQFDETATYLSSRIIAFLIEPRHTLSLSDTTAKLLGLMIDLCKAKGKHAEKDKYARWCLDLSAGNVPKRSRVVPELQRIISQVGHNQLTGHPERDWTRVKNTLLSSSATAIVELGKNAEYLMAFNRGAAISKGLSQKWQEYGEYRDARAVLDSAIVETQIVSENRNQTGINVMTVHKAKGKEFDCVILFQNPHSSPFVLRGDKTPFKRSRKLLFVGITRAKHHTLILSDVSQSCPILGVFAL